MSDYTLTANFSLYKPTPGADDDVWGDHLNLNADTLDELIQRYLPLSGGGMVGPLTLAGDAAASLQAVTLQQLNGAIAGAPFLPLSGGSMVGSLTLAGDAAASLQAVTLQQLNGAIAGAPFLPLTGGALTGSLTLAADPVGALGAVTRQYADLRVLRSGDTMVGPLVLSGDPATALGASTRQYVDAQIASANSTTAATYVPLSQKAAALGVATLDETGKLLSAQLPSVATGTLSYKGGWNAATNTPTMASGALAGGVLQPIGNYYVVTVSGTTAAIDGVTSWVAGDWISSNGTIWQRVLNSTSPYLPLTGGTLSGALTTFGGGIVTQLDPRIPDVAYGWQDAAGNVGATIDTAGAFHMPAAYVMGNPTVALGVAPKQYVDSAVAAGPFVHLTGDAMTGPLTLVGGAIATTPDPHVPGVGFAWQDAAGNIGLMVDPTGGIRFGAAYVAAAPTQPLGVASKGYVDSAIIASGPIITSGTITPSLLVLQENSIAALDPRVPDYKFAVQDTPGNVIGGIDTSGQLAWHALRADVANVASGTITQLALGSYNVTAAGVDQATATPLPPGVAWITAAASGTGVVLTSVPGGVWSIYHNGANPVSVYPPGSAALGAAAPGSPLSLTPATSVILWQTSPTSIGVLQAGGAGGGGGSVYVGTGFNQPRDEHDRVADTVNVFDLVSGLDPTGVADNSAAIKTAHDAARSKGYRFLSFPKGIYNAPSLTTAAGVIFVGDGASLKGAYRKLILPMRAGSYGRPAATVTPTMVPRLRAAMAAATTVSPAKIAIVGDSTTALAADTASGENLKSLLFRKLKKDFGNVPFVIDELGIGGSRFDHLAIPGPPVGLTFPPWYTNTSLRWMSYVQSGNYDLVILNFGTNDQINLDIWCIDSIVTEIQAFAHPADIAFTAQYTPQLNNAGTGTRAGQEGREYAEGYVRTYASRKGFGLFDFNRQTTLVRDGYDPLEGSMKLLAIADQNFPYTLPQETLHYAWRGIVAAGVWGHGKLQFQIGSRADNLLILERDGPTGHLAFTVQSIATASPFITTGTIFNSVPRTVTPLDLTADPVVSYDFEVRGGQVFCRATSGSNFYEINVMADRYGGLFTPVISWSDGSTSVFVSVKLATAFQPNLYMPQATDDEMFIDGHGADGLTHIQAGGMAKVWAPVIDGARFV